MLTVGHLMSLHSGKVRYYFLLQMGETLGFKMFNHFIFNLLILTTEIFGICLTLCRDNLFQSSIYAMISCSKEGEGEWKRRKKDGSSGSSLRERACFASCVTAMDGSTQVRWGRNFSLRNYIVS